MFRPLPWTRPCNILCNLPPLRLTTTASARDGTVTIQLDAPGLTREQLTIELEDQTVSLASVADAPRSLQRAWKLPAAIDAAQSTASLVNGVLTLSLATHQPTPAVHKLVIA